MPRRCRSHARSPRHVSPQNISPQRSGDRLHEPASPACLAKFTSRPASRAIGHAIRLAAPRPFGPTWQPASPHGFLPRRATPLPAVQHCCPPCARPVDHGHRRADAHPVAPATRSAARRGISSHPPLFFRRCPRACFCATMRARPRPRRLAGIARKAASARADARRHGRAMTLVYPSQFRDSAPPIRGAHHHERFVSQSKILRQTA